MSGEQQERFEALAEGFTDFYNQQSEVAFVMVSASVLEALVADIVELIAPGFTKRVEITHATRTELLHRMGVLHPEVAKALGSFASIRNRYAHAPRETSFQDDGIVQHSKNLRNSILKAHENPNESVFDDFKKIIDGKFAEIGYRPLWEDETAKRIISSYFMLGYHLIWAITWSPEPQNHRFLDAKNSVDSDDTHSNFM